MDLLINIDGGSRGNPGPAAAGVTIRGMPGNVVLHEAGYWLGEGTNNFAEYSGLLKALDLLDRLKAYDGGKVHIQSDSELMVKQINGEYRMKSPDLKPLFDAATSKLRKLKNWKLEHVLRGRNARADELANMALDAGRDVIVVAGDGSQASVPTVKSNPGGGAAPSPSASPIVSRSPASGPKKPRSASAQAESGANLFSAGPAPLFTARLAASPGAACPAHCPAKTPFAFGPKLPASFCVYAAQAVFDEDPTLWREAHRTEAQTQCAKCGVTIHIERG